MGEIIEEIEAYIADCENEDMRKGLKVAEEIITKHMDDGK